MKTFLCCLSSCLLGAALCWVSLKPQYGAGEEAFYDHVVYYHSCIKAKGTYGSSSSSLLAAEDLTKDAENIKDPVFRNRAKGLIVAMRQTHQEEGAKEFEARAENFFSVYSSAMR